MESPFEISDLRERPHFREAVADRIWRAWWQGRGYPLSHIAGLLEESLRSQGIPFAFAAHRGETFLGTASVIASDLGERPQYTPWVAAVWVEPDHRSRGVGGALVRQAAQAAFGQGSDRIYLCALPAKRSFYEGLGWQRLEEDVGEHRLTVFCQVPL